MKRSIFKFEELEGHIEVFWAQISKPNEVFQSKSLGKVQDTRKFRGLFQSKLMMMDDDTWAQPGKWMSDGWVVRFAS